MSTSASSFVASSLSVYHNAIKSLIFSTADVLFGMSITMLFSLIASKVNSFTSYLMLTEGYIQQAIFVFSRGFSTRGLLILCFAIVYTAARLYGTLIWGLDAPGYIMQARNVSASSLDSSLLDDPAYITYIDLGRSPLSSLERNMPQLIGVNLFKSNLNFTLTPQVDRGSGETVLASKSKVGGRIWLDAEGLSVSPDSYFMTTYTKDEHDNTYPLICPMQNLNENSQFWNCTFDNGYVMPLLQLPVGMPEVHWDDASDNLTDSTYVRPDRMKNIWAAFGPGGGTAVMKQMFTVTKGTRRHTFIETTFRATMYANPAAPFSQPEVQDFLKRSWSMNKTEQQDPFISKIYNSIIEAQADEQSTMFGLNNATKLTTTQVSWEFLTPLVAHKAAYSFIRVVFVNITLIRSEDILEAPIPFETCDNTFENVAYGGRVTDTDCTMARKNSPRLFQGQLDTSAVTIVYGLGDGRSNVSAQALNQTTWEWINKNSERMNDLLISRGFIVSINSSLVTVEVSTLRPAISFLQISLCLLAGLFAGLAWLCLYLFAPSQWSNTLLSNILAATAMPDDIKAHDPGYILDVPEIVLEKTGSRYAILVDNQAIKLEGESPPTFIPLSHQPFIPRRPVNIVNQRQYFPVSGNVDEDT
jgi:hypothetical protein